MTLSTKIAPHLPYLRRFARSVTGSQTSGDAYVAATLEALIADITIFPETSSDRISLYRLFCTFYKTTTVETKQIETPYMWEKRAAENFAHVPSLARQAFLLMAVEEFSNENVSEILDRTPAEISDLISEASSIIVGQVATDIMIIEDEPMIAMDIEQLVTDLGHTVTGIARTHKEAIALYNRVKPQMVLADIQLADGSSGIDAVNDILKTSDIPVIFITAFPERLLTGDKPEPAFLVTKPFSHDMVKALISQALFFNEKNKAI